MKRWFVWLLVLVLLPLSARAGGDGGYPYVDTGLAAVVDSSEWALYDHGYSIYVQDDRAAAVLANQLERRLVLFAREGRAWRVADSALGPLCQSIMPDIRIYNMDALLVIEHETTLRSLERYVFAPLEKGDYALSYTELRTPLNADLDKPYVGDEPVRLVYQTIEGTALVSSYYTEDLYGKMPDAKVEAPGGGYWVLGAEPQQRIDLDGPILLSNFHMDSFPVDPYTQQMRTSKYCYCGWKLGHLDPRRVTATVRTDKPENRLNLRVAPNSKSDYIGKYYSGTKVYVLEDLGNGWAKVDVGSNRVGYMMTQYLAFGEEGDCVVSAMPRFTMPREPWMQLRAPFDESHARDHIQFRGGEEIEVMGIVSGWWHIRCQGEVGFIRALKEL